MALGEITLELDGLSLVLKGFKSYTPMQEPEDQRLAFTRSTHGAGIIKGRYSPGQLIAFSLLTTDSSLIKKFNRLKSRQKAMVDAKTFAGIKVTNERDLFVEDASTPTRKYISSYTSEGSGQISYYAKLLMGMVVTFAECKDSLNLRSGREEVG